MYTSLLFSKEHHPLLVTPAGDTAVQALCDYVRTHSGNVSTLLSQHGAILFRGFALRGPDDLATCAKSLGAQAFGYVGGNSPRTAVAADVFTSTEYPASQTISLHNEMSYLPEWPRRLFFYSHLPAESGGQTSLANGRDVLQSLQSCAPALVERMRSKRIDYIRNFRKDVGFGKSWQSTYATEDFGEVEQLLHKQGSTWEWLADGTLRVHTVRDALTRHPESGEEVWFNQAEQWHPSALHPDIRAFCEQNGVLAHDCTHGDGTPFDEGELEQVRTVLQQNKLLFDWRQGDLLMIDNVSMMHGREPFKGQRKTLTYLSAV